MPCPGCGYRNPANNLYCGHCGASLQPAPTPAGPADKKRTGPLPLFEARAGFQPHASRSTEIEGPRQDMPEPVAHDGIAVEAGNARARGDKSRVAIAAASQESESPTPPQQLDRAEIAQVGADAQNWRSPAEQSSTTISNENTGFDTSYLYDETPTRAINWRATSALVLVLLFAGFLVYVWRQYPSWHSMIVRPPQEQAKLLSQNRDAPSTAGATGSPATTTGNSGGPKEESPQTAAAGPQDGSNAKSGHDGKRPDTSADKAALKDDSRQDLKQNMKTSTSDGGVSGSKNGAPGRSDGSSDRDQRQLAATKPSANLAQSDGNSSSGPRSSSSSPNLSKAATAVPVSEVDPGETQYREGMAYLEGRGEPQSCSQAVTLLDSAAAKGNPKAASQLGAMYATGHCVRFDRPTAYRWFTNSLAERHNPLVERNREMLWSQMSDAERRLALAQR
jgi:hypothetical protein